MRRGIGYDIDISDISDSGCDISAAFEVFWL